jgi:hypothetical protein
MTRSEHIRRAREYERTAAMLTVRGHQHIQDPEPFWCLAEVHRAWAHKLAAA